MFFLTLGDLKQPSSPINRISGLCSASDSRFPSYVDEAVRKLMKRGDWASTVVPIQVCIRRGCVTWPRYVGSIRKMNLCGVPVPVTNIWSNYLDRDVYPRWYDFPGLIGWNQLASSYGFYGGRDGLRYSWSGVNKTGHYSTYSDPLVTSFIRAYPQYPQDVGKTLTIFGKDENGQPLQHKVTASDGTVTYEPGTIITIGSSGASQKWGSTDVMVQPPIERVIKDVTQGQVYLYAYDPNQPVGSDLFDLAVYAPTETNPCYERTSIPGRTSTDGSTTDSVMALVKLKHIPVVHDTDLVTIPDVDALKVMIQSALFDEADDADKADRYEAKAIRELNLMLRDTYPEDQTPITNEPFNAIGVGPQQMF